jgi:4,5-DOPA dioxygenase extradiol
MTAERGQRIEARAGEETWRREPIDGRMPTVYLAHGAPVLVVSAHWESAPLTIGATRPVPLVYDFSGFDRKYYEVTYPAPGAPEVAEGVRRLLSDLTPTADEPERGLDHGAYVPLLAMYPEADVPVLQISMPSEDPRTLFEVGRTLAPLRDEAVLIMGSGFLTHSFDAIRRSFAGDDSGERVLREFDQWAWEAMRAGEWDTLFNYRQTAPALRYAHPTVDHFVPLFVTLGAAAEDGTRPETAIDGFWFGNSKRSVEFA